MESFNDGSLKKRNRREKLNKRWSENEIKNILKYLEHNQEFEVSLYIFFFCLFNVFDLISQCCRNPQQKYCIPNFWKVFASMPLGMF